MCNPVRVSVACFLLTHHFIKHLKLCYHISEQTLLITNYDEIMNTVMCIHNQFVG